MREAERGICLLYNEEENIVLIALNIMTQRTGQNNLFIINGYEGKATPLQVWRGPEGSRRLRLPDFKTVGT